MMDAYIRLETAVALIATNDNGTGVSYSGNQLSWWDDSDPYIF